MLVLDVYTLSYGMKVPSLPFSGSRDALLDEINFSSAPPPEAYAPTEGGSEHDSSTAASAAAATSAAAAVVKVVEETVKTSSSSAAPGSCYTDDDVGTDEYKDNNSRLFTDHLRYPDGSKDVHASSSSSLYTSSSSSSSVWMRPPLPQSAFAPIPHAIASYPPPVHDDDHHHGDHHHHHHGDHDDDDDHSHSDGGDDTPFDMPPPSDTPSTMGTSTPSFDDLALPRGNVSVHGANVSLDLGSKYYELQQQGQLGKRYRDEY